MSLKDALFHQITTNDGTTAGTPLANQFDSGILSDTVSFAKYQKAYFILYWGVGATHTLTLTVIPTDTAGNSNTETAIPFNYRIITQPDTNAGWIRATSLLTTAGSSQMYIIQVDAEDLPVISGVKYEYAYLDIAETNAVAALGGVIIIMDEPRFAQAVPEIVTA